MSSPQPRSSMASQTACPGSTDACFVCIVPPFCDRIPRAPRPCSGCHLEDRQCKPLYILDCERAGKPLQTQNESLDEDPCLNAQTVRKARSCAVLPVDTSVRPTRVDIRLRNFWMTIGERSLPSDPSDQIANRAGSSPMRSRSPQMSSVNTSC
jgi:hypothetical protein